MRYVRQQLIKLVIVVVAVTMLTFTLLSLLPGDRAVAIGGIGRTEREYEQIRDEWGLDAPLPVQYVTWLGKFVTGDLGVSSNFNTGVDTLIGQRLPRTVLLMVYAQVIALAIAIPLGIVAAARANSALDRAVSTGAFALLSVPNYVLGVLLSFLFAVNVWKILPAASEYIGPFANPWQHVQAMLLPALTLAIPQIAVYMRLLRADMVATLQNDFITMARAKGLSTRQVLLGHALRPSTFSLITAAAVNVGALIGGSVVVEQIFGLAGMGSLTIEAILRRDFLVVQTCVVIFAVAFVFINFVVDVMYGFIDPRIRHARALA